MTVSQWFDTPIPYIFGTYFVGAMIVTYFLERRK
jgi:hypothetical protein